MMDVVKLAFLAMVTVVAVLILRQLGGGWGQWISIAAALLIAFYILGDLADIKALTDKFESVVTGTDGTYMKLLWKALGVTYLCEFASDLCRENGNGLIARQIEICGKISVLLMGIPILLTLLDTIAGYGV